MFILMMKESQSESAGLSGNLTYDINDNIMMTIDGNFNYVNYDLKGQ